MKKYTLALFIFTFVLLSFNINTKSASADDSGCIGAAYSSTTGAPCDTTTIPDTIPNTIPDTIPTYPSGCTSAVGFSATTGALCDTSNSSVPTYPNAPQIITLILPAGCISSMEWSSTTGAPCDTTPGYPSGCLLNTGYSSTTGLACNRIANISAFSVPSLPTINFDDFKVLGYKVHGCAGGYNHVTTKDDCAYTVEGSNSGQLYTYTQILDFKKNGCVSNTGYSSTTGVACDGTGVVSTSVPISVPVPDDQNTWQIPDTTPPQNLPDGCTSTAGYSRTLGAPCDHFQIVSPSCTSTSGYSPATGLSCDHPHISLPGCTSLPGYSTTTGEKCLELAPQWQGPTPVPVITFPSLSPPPASPSSTCTITSVLRIGSMGDEVACLQLRVGLIPDGKFGPRTQIAIKAFQANAGLKADGIVGPRSIKALEIVN